MREPAIRILHWVCNSPAPYNDQLFQSLSQALAVRVNFHFTEPISAAHSWSCSPASEYPSRCYKRRLGVDWSLVRWVCLDRRALFLTNCWQDPTSQIILLFLILTNRPYLIWNDTPSLRRKRNFLKRRLRQIFLRIVFRRAGAVLGTGKVALAVLAQMGCPHEKLVDFPYFIDIDRFSPARQHQVNQPIVFGSCGRLHHDKGYDLALRALACVFRGQPREFRYRLAGTGPEAAALAELARNLEIADQVDFLGWLDPDDLPGFYRGLDCLLHPARTEPYGVSVLEAMACGAMVVASDQTAVALDRIENGVNGFLHASDDVNGLSSRIIQAMSLGTAKRYDLSVAARQAVEAWPTSRGVHVISRLLCELDQVGKTAGHPERADEASTP